MLSTFWQGVGLGLAIAAPVGPIGILCIRRTLAYGPLTGMVSGLGAATADGLYGCVAGFGLTVVADLLIHQAEWLRLGGGLFLCYLGLRALLARPAVVATSSTGTAAEPAPGGRIAGRSLLTAYSSTLILTLTNPATIVSFTAMFAAMGLVESGAPSLAAVVLVAGVFVGSASWWLLLSQGVNLFRSGLTAVRMRWLNRVSGTILLLFGVVALMVKP